MRHNEGVEFKEYLVTMLSPWAIVAFDYGKLDGSGYGN